MTRTQRIAVIGGGIAGLAAASRCRALSADLGAPVEITVFERSNRVGGCIETRSGNGFILEMGPDSLVTEKPAAVNLAKRLGLADEIEPIRPEFRGARVVRGGRLVPIPEDFRLFTPTSLAGLVASRLFSPLGVVRAAIEPFIAAKQTADDESLASFVTRRFGREVLERLAQPLIGGIYSGDPKRLSMQATLPQLLEMERKYGSLVRGMRTASAIARRVPALPRLVSLRRGLGSLVAELQRELGDSIRTRSEVVQLQRPASAGYTTWKILLDGGRKFEADAVICALPAQQAARLLADLEPRVTELLRAIKYHSVATVTVVYVSSEIPPLPRCTGFVVPQVEGRTILATTFSTQKFANRAPEGFTVLRAFIGGAVNEPMVALDDATLVDTVRREFRELLGIVAQPERSIVSRWKSSLPEYALGHTELVDQIQRGVTGLSCFALVGSAYRGVGIADCVRSGEQAAEVIHQSLAHLGMGILGFVNQR